MIEVTAEDVKPDNVITEIQVLKLQAVRGDVEIGYKRLNLFNSITDVALAQKKIELDSKTLDSQNDFASKIVEAISNINVNPFHSSVLGETKTPAAEPSLPSFTFKDGENETGIVEVSYDVCDD